MDIFLFDGPQWQQLLPLSYTRSLADLRMGYLSLKQKWEHLSDKSLELVVNHSLRDLYPSVNQRPGLYINSCVLPSKELWDLVSKLDEETSLYDENTLIAFRSHSQFDYKSIETLQKTMTPNRVGRIERYWDIFLNLGDQIELDFTLLKEKGSSQELKDSNTIIGDRIICLGQAEINAATINTEKGPVIIGEGAEIMEGSVIRGPFVLGDYSQVKLAAKIYGPSSIGPHSKVGGEFSNSLIQGYSNKGHDGFIGNSVIGEWCNFGADTNISNLKNNYSEVKVWDYASESYINSAQQFCGLCMGDHSKTGINTMINTGTAVGVSANVFGAGFPDKFVPSFAWGAADSTQHYDLAKALDTAERVKARRDLKLSKEERDILSHIHEKESHFFSE